MDRVGILLTLGSPDEHGLVPRRIPGETADRDHRIEHRHVRAIRKRAGLRSFADDADLVRNRANEARYDDGDERFLDVFAEQLFVLASEGGRCFADRHDILDQRIESRPSGRTGTVIDNSGLRQTKMLRLSPGPMRYSAEGRDDAGGAGGRVGPPPHPATKRAVAAVMARKPVRCTLRSCPAFSNLDEY